MQPFFIIVACVAVVSVALIIALRIHLKKQSEELSDRLDDLIAFHGMPDSGQEGDGMPDSHGTVFRGIQTDLDGAFHGKIITATQRADFTNHYKPYYEESHSLARRLEAFHLEPSEIISQLIRDYEDIEWLVKQHNEAVIKNLLETYKDFFDTCLKYPLDRQQRHSIVSEEDNCLVVSSAGSGKTSSIVGKVKYLTEIKGIKPERILLVTYTNKAAAELTQRIATVGLKGYTFHKLAIDIIGKVTGTKPSVCDNTDALFLGIYHDLLNEPDFKKGIVDYFIDYQDDESCWEQRRDERRAQLSEQKDVKLKALFPDMDGRTVYVRSKQEQQICSALFALGVKFRYEEPYEYPVADDKHSQYRPDFSIYFEVNGAVRRIYLEHFGTDEHSRVPFWFAQENNMTYEEANQRYNDGITWKKAAHAKFGTRLLVTSSADFHYYRGIKEKLKGMLEREGVPVQEKSDEELYDLVLPKGSKQEKAFIRLAVTFVTLLKSSCKSVESVLGQARKARDKRGILIIGRIFRPVYERYAKALSDSHTVDFTDLILQATEICRTSHPVAYDYIIVDEFQDIAVDRYNFLKALREGNPPAKLYCVGDDWQSIYRFSGSDMALFNQFPAYFGATEINRIETTYRFGEPLLSLSSRFIQRNDLQVKKDIHPCRQDMKTDLDFYACDRQDYCKTIATLVASVPRDKSIFLLGRYSFDDYFLSFVYHGIKEGKRFYYVIGGRKVEFLTVHKAKGLEADYAILLQCNKDVYGFPSLVSDDPVLNYVLTESDRFPFGEERRLFYVAITRARVKTMVLYDWRFPSVFVDEFLHPERFSEVNYAKHRNANKRWTRKADLFLVQLHREGKSVEYIANKMGRSKTAIIMRLDKLRQS